MFDKTDRVINILILSDGLWLCREGAVLISGEICRDDLVVPTIEREADRVENNGGKRK